MADTGFWTFPPDRITHGSGVRYELTVLHPPFTVEVDDLPLNGRSAPRSSLTPWARSTT
ncbi:hypothetical protein AB0D12_14535 [Streptomyces sp. NPDC048479]|uniref:hypothetical protein n=1 Tax=Streptomyces sp. NPDC048479 TaxID=3154725 RepID=UPI003447F5DB